MTYTSKNCVAEVLTKDFSIIVDVALSRADGIFYIDNL